MVSLLSKLPRQAFELSAYTLNALTGNVYLRFLGLRTAAERAFEAGEIVEAEHLSKELLRLADQFNEDWNYGNAVHHGHLLLGRIYLKRQHVDAAGEQLLLATNTPGSPQLSSFGPNMLLAKEFLLSGGKEDVVLRYLDACSRFWGQGNDIIGEMATTRIEEWKEAIASSKIPEFGANLYY